MTMRTRRKSGSAHDSPAPRDPQGAVLRKYVSCLVRDRTESSRVQAVEDQSHGDRRRVCCNRLRSPPSDAAPTAPVSIVGHDSFVPSAPVM